MAPARRRPVLPRALLAALLAAAALPAARAQDTPGRAATGGPTIPGGPPAPAAKPAHHRYEPATEGKGRLEVLESGLAVLHLAGTPEEMGTQHGTLLREPIRVLVRDYLPKVLRGDRAAALEKARALEKQVPERFVREMKAVAAAAGVPYDDILLGSVVVELFGLHACSAAAAFGAATPDGRTVVGRNLEWPDHGILGAYGLVVAARPEGRRPFVAAGFPAFAGVVTGMNGDGLFAAELVVMNGGRVDPAKGLQGVPWPILLRRLLEEGASVPAAAALVREAPRTVPQNLLLADPREGLVLECGADRCETRPPADGLVAVTNYWNERTVDQPADPRYRGLCAAFAPLAGGKVDAAAMEKAIRGASKGGFVAALNLQCGVFLPATLEIRISLGRPPAAARPFVVLDGAALLGVRPPAAAEAAK